MLHVDIVSERSSLPCLQFGNLFVKLSEKSYDVKASLALGSFDSRVTTENKSMLFLDELLLGK